MVTDRDDILLRGYPLTRTGDDVPFCDGCNGHAEGNPQNIPLDGLSVRKLGSQHNEHGSDLDARVHDYSPLLPMAHSDVGLDPGSLHTAQLRGQSDLDDSLNACERNTEYRRRPQYGQAWSVGSDM